MDCKLCGTHILATMSIVWNGDAYHPDCIGQAVAQKDAAYRTSVEVSNYAGEYPDNADTGDDDDFDEYVEYADDGNDDFDEYEQYQNEDEIDEIESEIENYPDVSDDVLNQIPISVGNGHRRIINPEAIEPAQREVHINDVTASVSNRFAAERHERDERERQERRDHSDQHAPPAVRAGTLMVGRDARLVGRKFLSTLPEPIATETFKPIHHALLIDRIMDSLWYRRMNVVRDEYAVSDDGMKMFGLIELDVEYKGVRFAIGLRNANDRSMRVAMVAGYKVTVCSNMMLQGDFQPMLAKHSKHFELQDALSIACDRVQRNFGRLHREITDKQERIIEPAFARELCYQAFTDGKFPISLMRTVHREYFERPSHKEFETPTLFSLENAFTTSFKKLQPVQQFQATAKLGKFLAAYGERQTDD